MTLGAGSGSRCWRCPAASAAACRSLVSDYRTFQLTLALVYAIAILGLNILTGYNGQFSLGHGAFYAIGAYIAAIMMRQVGDSPITGPCRSRD